jgi:hypothetical protein
MITGAVAANMVMNEPFTVNTTPMARNVEVTEMSIEKNKKYIISKNSYTNNIMISDESGNVIHTTFEPTLKIMRYTNDTNI